MNQHTFCLTLFLAITASLTSISANASSIAVASSNQQYGSYVILGQAPNGDNVAIARTVIDANLACPTVSSVPANGANPQTMITRDNPYYFSVMVCEALVTFDKSYQLNFADQAIALPMAKSNPQHIQVFGDTGCKTKECALGTAAEPFKSLANSGALKKPDLVLHMGDYNYRGTGGQVEFTMTNGQGQLQQIPQSTYDAGDGLDQAQHCGQDRKTPYYSQAAINGNRPDTWLYWHNDLFMSAKKLMLSAPWIVARGNHELCSRAGAGYFYFLDPHSHLVKGQQQLSCPAPDIKKSVMANTVQIDNYIVSFDNLNVAVIDSANACDSFTNSPFQHSYNKVFRDLSKQLKNTSNDTWLVTHRPIWGVQKFDSGTSADCSTGQLYGCVNQMMQQAIANLPTKSLDPSVKLVLTGHMHKFESVTFSDGSNPPNIIIGNSGVKLSGSMPDPSAVISIDKRRADVLTTNQQVTKGEHTFNAFGFFDIQYNGKGNWHGHVVNPPKGLILAKCSSKANLAQGVCELAKGVGAID